MYLLHGITYHMMNCFWHTVLAFQINPCWKMHQFVLDLK